MVGMGNTEMVAVITSVEHTANKTTNHEKQESSNANNF